MRRGWFTVSLSSPSCPFCFLGRNGKSKYFESLFLGQEDSDVVFSSEKFFLVPDIAPVGLGHALIVSKQHTGNLLSVWNGEDAEAASLIRRYRRWSKEKGFEFMIAFEHGLGSIGSEKATCIDHAHIHLLPFSSDVHGFCDENELIEVAKSDHLDIGSDKQFMLLDMGGASFFFKSAASFESQLFRHFFCRAAGLRHWHWRDFVDFHVELETKSRFQDTRDYMQEFIDSGSE